MKGVLVIRNCDAVTKQILESATAEFRSNGFDKASVRAIAKKANVTTGALYARYSNKDALFSAVVDPVIEKFWQANNQGNEDCVNKINLDAIDEIWGGSRHSSVQIVDLIYENKTIFTILINGANGSQYEHFVDTIVAYEEQNAQQTLLLLKKKGYACADISAQVIHMLISAHCYALFEIVRHNLSREDALAQVMQINDFFTFGWNKIFGL